MVNSLAARKLIYLINPISGGTKKDELLKLIRLKTERAGLAFEMASTNVAGDYKFLENKIQQEGITDIIVCGGDGSMSAVTGALLHMPVNFGIIPMGSGNGLALTARIPTTPAKAIDVVLKGESSPVDGFFVNGKFSCMLVGAGLDGNVAHKFASAGRRGLKTYIRISASEFLKSKPFAFRVESANMDFTTDAYFISIANSNQFGNNFKIAPEASLKDGLLDVVIVKKMHKLLLPFFIVRQISGWNMVQELDESSDSKNIIYFQTSELLVHNLDNAPIHIDGDPTQTAALLSIKVIPNAYRLLHPAL